LESKKLLDRNDLLAEVCNEFKSIFESWDAGEDLLSYYKNTSATLNSKVKAIQPTGEVSGLAIDILPTGALLLEGEVEITVGDLIHLRY
jgi:biotin-(acetyl-CoA carboxylase) ligase